LKDGNTDNSITGGITVFRDESEGNTDQTIAGDCGNKSDLNADGQGADKYLATDSVLPCEDDTTCTDGVILSLDLPCSTKNETVSKNTSSDAELPLLDGTCELVDRPSTPRNGLSEKRPASDRTLEENERVIPGDAKTERHYKRRKVLALEKQSSFSGATSTD
jgi:sentrin-specific protease 7